jgi:hypothetical protein
MISAVIGIGTHLKAAELIGERQEDEWQEDRGRKKRGPGIRIEIRGCSLFPQFIFLPSIFLPSI